MIIDETSERGMLRDAATVILLRDGADGMEVFLVRRVGAMAFAGGMTVFPGGGVDAQDDDPRLGWSGPEPAWWADRFAVDEARARRLVCAAARETFEECGVLLAGDEPGRVVAQAGHYAEARRALERHELTFSDFLNSENLMLDSEQLRPWAHWITPEGEPRRYDTRFFVAALPQGQHADGATSEAADTVWASPAWALDEWRSGRSMLLPPTWAQLERLSAFDTVAQVLDENPVIAPIQPVLIREGDGFRVEFDGDERYYGSAARG